MLPVVQDPAVDLVREDHEIPLTGDGRDPLQVVAREHAAGGVGRRVDDDQARARRDQRDQLVHVEPEVVRLADGDRYRGRAHEPGDRRIDRVARIGHDHLVAGVDQGHDRVVHDALAADGHEHPVVRDLETTSCAEVGGDRGAQLGDAGERRIVGGAGVEGALGRVADVVRSVEVGFADLEVDHLAPGRLHGPGPRGGLERRLGADVVHARREPHAVRSFRRAACRLSAGRPGSPGLKARWTSGSRRSSACVYRDC